MCVHRGGAKIKTTQKFLTGALIPEHFAKYDWNNSQFNFNFGFLVDVALNKNELD